MHVHDDFGLATAGAIAAATAGIARRLGRGRFLSGRLRAARRGRDEPGSTDGVDTGIRLDRFTSLADLVARETGVAIPPLKPLVGEYAFLRHMPGDVLACLQRGTDAFPPVAACINPRMIGARMRWVWDNLTTDAMVRALAATIGEKLFVDETASVRAALDGAVENITTYPRWLTADRATQICRDSLRSYRETSAPDRNSAAAVGSVHERASPASTEKEQRAI